MISNQHCGSRETELIGKNTKRISDYTLMSCIYCALVSKTTVSNILGVMQIHILI